MRIGLSCIRIVLALGIKGNKKEVAKTFNVTTDHISRQVRLFDELTGITVFEKVGNETVLTPDGAKALSLILSFAKQWDQFIAAKDAGYLRIGFSNSIIACAFMEPVTAFLDNRSANICAPNIHPYAELATLMKLGLIDVAVTGSDEMLMNGACHYTGEYDLSLLTLKDDPISMTESFITPSVAALKPLITSEGIYNELLSDWLTGENKVVRFANDAMIIFALTERGYGCGVAPYISEQYYKCRNFRAMPFYPPLRSGFTINVNRESGAEVRAEPFLKMLRENSVSYHMRFK